MPAHHSAIVSQLATALKVLFVKKLYSPVGGSETLVHQWAHRLVARGHEVRVLSLWPLRRRHNFPPTDSVVAVGRHYRGFDDHGVAVYQLAPRGGVLGKLVDLLPFGHLIREGVALSLAEDFDLVHNVCREYTRAALAIACRYHLPLVLTPLPHPGQPFSGDSPGDAALYRRASGIVAMTHHERRWYESLGVSPDRVAVVASGGSILAGADGRQFRQRHEIHGRMVLFVGRKEPYKGYLAIKAAAPSVWRTHPDTTFVFIGEPGLWARWTDPILDRRDERLLSLSVVSEAEKAAAYAACDVFCMPSAHETLGLTYLEAWSYGKPVIGGDIPPLREVIRDGVDGLLVSQNAGEVAKAVCVLLDDPIRAREMGEAGRRRVASDFDWPVVVGKLEGFYRRMLGEPCIA